MPQTRAQLKAAAQSSYKQGKYGEAMVSLNEAIRLSNDDDISLFDIRAAVLEKTGDLKAALKDGQRILRLDKAAPQGYLRTGKILQAMSEHETALKIYERGLKLVPKIDKYYDFLRKQQTALFRTLRPTKSVDFLTLLPYEIIELVVKYLPFYQLCRCLRVSRPWRKCLTTWPAFWRNLELTSAPAKRSVRLQAVFQYMAWSKFDIQQASIQGIDLQGNNKFLQELIVKCPKLHTLEIHGGGELRQSLLNATSRAKTLRILVLGPKVPVEPQILHRILDDAPCLEVARFESVQARTYPGISSEWSGREHMHLQELSIFWDISLDSNRNDALLPSICPVATNLRVLRFIASTDGAAMLRFEELMKIFPRLQELYLRNVTIRSYRTSPPINGYPGSQNPPLRVPPSITKLSLINTRSPSPLAAGIDTSIDLPLLSELHLSDRYDNEIGIRLVEDLLQCSNTLQSVPLESLCLSAQKATKLELLDLLSMQRLHGLRRLSIHGRDDIDDELAGHIADKFKHLTSLALPTSKITGVAVKKFVQSLPQLARLDLKDCQHVSPDAVEWARKQGIKVGHQLTSF